MRVLALATLCALAGCNQIFGLDPTSLGVDAHGCPHRGDPGFVDEDGDTIDDTCDNCPADPNLDQADSDHDGVGDACDLTTTPTQILYFDGFHGTTLSSEWVQGALDHWTVSNDAVTLQSGGATSLLTLKDYPVEHGRIETALIVSDLPAATDHYGGISFDVTGAGAGTAGFLCGVDEEGTTTVADTVIDALTLTSNTNLAGQPMDGTFGTGARITVNVEFASGSQRCTAQINDPVTVTSADTTNTTGRAGIAAVGIRFTIPYVVVYEELP